ncbi:MAG: ribonuclease D [Thiomicrorhabdus sp.]|nr:MAG: ribonuclease D [Thiomicrorhabdus sp.]
MNKQAYLSVNTESQLRDYCQQIINNPEITWIAVDTEFVRVDTFFPELSLVQVQDCFGQAVIIDPLLIRESASDADQANCLNPLVDLLTDANTLKVFHSARQDIEVLYQLAHKLPVSIFDTQLATLFLKHGEMAGFARVVLEELGISIDKSQTRTNWHARPLTDEQIQYAIDDVRYLAPLYEVCLKKLSPEQLNAVSQDCMDMLDESLYIHNPKVAGDKVKGIKAYRPKQLAIVYALAEWREQFAIDHNRPKKWVMSDDVITQICKRPPKTVEALYKVPQIKASSVKGYGEEWIAVLDRVFAQPPEAWPQPPAKPPSPTPQEDVLIQLCMSYAQQVVLDYRLTMHSLMQRHDILYMMRNLPPEKPLLTGWRYQLVGQHLQAIINGQATLKVINQKLVLSAS